MFCSECGNNVGSNVKFCPSCGTRQTTEGFDSASDNQKNQSQENNTSDSKSSFFSAAAASAIDAAKKITVEAKRINEEHHIKEKVEAAAAAAKAAAIDASNRVGAEAKRINDEHHIKERVMDAAAAAKAAAAEASTQLGEDIKRINAAKNETINEGTHESEATKTGKAQAISKSFWSKLNFRQKILVTTPIIVLLIYLIYSMTRHGNEGIGNNLNGKATMPNVTGGNPSMQNGQSMDSLKIVMCLYAGGKFSHSSDEAVSKVSDAVFTSYNKLAHKIPANEAEYIQSIASAKLKSMSVDEQMIFVSECFKNRPN